MSKTSFKYVDLCLKWTPTLQNNFILAAQDWYWLLIRNKNRHDLTQFNCFSIYLAKHRYHEIHHLYEEGFTGGWLEISYAWFEKIMVGCSDPIRELDPYQARTRASNRTFWSYRYGPEFRVGTKFKQDGHTKKEKTSKEIWREFSGKTRDYRKAKWRRSAPKRCMRYCNKRRRHWNRTHIHSQNWEALAQGNADHRRYIDRWMWN